MKKEKLYSFYFNNNDRIYNQLKENYLKKTLSQSIIIFGEKGIGKSTFVKFFVTNLFNNFDENNNNQFNHKNLILNNSHPNFKTLSKLIDVKTNKFKNNIIIEQIREIESYVYQSSIYNLPKIILIDCADELNVNASNALLKILEEPKKNTIFFIISHQLSLVIPTILSRCIKFKFQKPNFNEFEKILISADKDLTNESDLISFLYNISNGSPGKALHLYTQESKYLFDKFLQICKNNNNFNNDIIEFSSILNKYNNEQFSNFLIIIKYVLISSLKINLGVNIQIDVSSNFKNNLFEISKYLNQESCFNAMDYLSEYENNLYTYNLDKKIFIFNLFSKIIKKQ